jgi:hypothetical protein
MPRNIVHLLPIPQRILTVYAQSQAYSQQQQQEDQDQPPPEVPAPTTPPSGPSSPAPDSMPPQDLVGRQVPSFFFFESALFR